MSAPDLIAALEANERVGGRIALVVAHPDDETIAIGSRLGLLDDLTLVHLTDGAPDDPAFAARAGFADGAAYAAARRLELEAALAALGAVPARRLAYGFPDQRTHDYAHTVAGRLANDLAGHDVVITHAYEHGHPDHDTAAFAVARACATMGAAAPERVEFAGYHRIGDEIAFGRFFPDARAPETRLPMMPAQRAAKVAAFAAHATQAGTLANFDPAREAVRPAPDYNFTRPAPPVAAAYALWGFALSPAAWLAAVS